MDHYVEQPKVTVCIPTWNRVGLLQKSLRSVLYQNYPNFEVVVSDNGSTDGTTDFLKQLDDPRVIHDRLPENIGLFGNMSRCLQLGDGKYRVVLPDDDLMLPGNLQRKVEFFETHPTVGLVHSAFRYLDGDALPIGPVENWARLTEDTFETGRSFIDRSINVGGIVCVSSVMTRSDLVRDEKFDATDGAYADMALWLRTASRADVGFLAEGLSGFLVHASSASSGFATIKVKRGAHQSTLGHADAILLAHGRFVENSPELDEAHREELRGALKRADRRLRMSLRANMYLPKPVLEGLKKASGWRSRGKIHSMLALDAAYGPPPLETQALATDSSR